MFFDAHNHLADPRLRPYREAILERSANQGIMAMAVNGTHPRDWEAVAALPALAQGYGIRIYPQFGLHPWRTAEPLPANWLDELQSYINLAQAGLGEIGLDGWKKNLPWQPMETAFLAQLELASALNLPTSIHCLKAWQPLLGLLEKHPLPKRGFLLHGYGGDLSIATQLLALHSQTQFSFSGYALQPRKQTLRETFKKLPQENIHLETDAPDMLPPETAQVHRLEQAKSQQNGYKALNSPANLAQIYSQAPFLPSAEQLRKNSEKFFNHDYPRDCKSHNLGSNTIQTRRKR